MGQMRKIDQLSGFGRPTNLMPPRFSADGSPPILLNSSRNWFSASVHLPKRVLMFSIKPKVASASIACSPPKTVSFFGFDELVRALRIISTPPRPSRRRPAGAR